MRYLIFATTLAFLFLGCEKPNQSSEKEVPNIPKPTLTLEEASRLSKLPLACIQVEYPNKLGQVIGSDDDLQSPKNLHPAFYGCFDWHSSVHGHWSLVSLLKTYPNLDQSDRIKQLLLENMTPENIEVEVAYFEKEINKSYERTYGWAWLLKLAEELHTWDDPIADSLSNNLQPLTDVIVNKYLEFLPKLNYPIRVGEHTNTAFGMSFAYDFAKTVGNAELTKLIETRSRDFYWNDDDCPLTWEPSGFDFLSPCLQEADLMRKTLPNEAYLKWLDRFLPQLRSHDFQWDTGKVSDRTDGKLVHLDGVNFSRAWCLYGIANQFPEYAHLTQVANQHVAYSLPGITDDNYEGTHWLASFAIFALNIANAQVD